MMENFDFYVQIIEKNLLKVKGDKKAALRLMEQIVVIDFYDQWCVNRLIQLVRQYQKEENFMWNYSNIWTFNGKFSPLRSHKEPGGSCKEPGVSSFFSL